MTIVVISLLIVSCKSRTQNHAESSDDLTIAYLPITHALPLLEMQRAGVKHIKLVKYGSWPELLDALNTGRVDAASVLIELAMKAKSQGLGLTAVALGHHSGNVIVVSRTINSALDLKGKSFAIPHRCSSHYILLREMLKKNGMKLSDVNIIELSPSEMPSALASGRISGYCVAEPFGAIAVSSGCGKVLYRSEQLWPNSVCCAIVFNDDYLKQNSKDVSQFLHEYTQAAERLKDKRLGLKALQSELKQQDKVLSQSLQWISFSKLSITKDDYHVLMDKVQQFGILKNPPSYHSFVQISLDRK